MFLLYSGQYLPKVVQGWTPGEAVTGSWAPQAQGDQHKFKLVILILGLIGICFCVNNTRPFSYEFHI